MRNAYELTLVCLDKANDDFVLRFTKNGEIVSEKEEDCVDNALIDVAEFFSSNCERCMFDSRFDTCKIDVQYDFDFCVD